MEAQEIATSSRAARHYRSEPWNVPVPVRRASFASLHRRHAHLAVEVDLAAIEAFGATRRGVAAEDLLYADLQVNPDNNWPLRLGSGRSGFYRGWYLKGIGRTPLAANWNLARERVHNSGALLASAAIREYVASRYLEAVGAADAIVPCDGLLLRPLPPALRGFNRLAFGSRTVAPADEALQAVSVKRAGFARHSNFTWLLGHLTPSLPPRRPFSLHRFFALLASHLGRPSAGAVDPGEPGALVGALAAAFERTLASFAAFLRHGVYWGSFHNNFAIDGRFLDLELPVLVGSPYFGSLSEDRRRVAPFGGSRWTLAGIEALHAARSCKHFVVKLRAGLGALLAAGAVRGAEKEQLREMTRLLASWMARRDGPFASPARRRELLIEILARELGLAGHRRDAFARVLARIVRGERAGRHAALTIRRLGLRPARPEIFFAPELFAFDELDLPPPDRERFELLNSEILRLEACRDRDTLLAELALSAARLRRRFSPTRTE